MGGGFRISYEKEKGRKNFCLSHFNALLFHESSKQAELLWNWKMVAMVAMEKNVHLHIVWCVGRERAWIHVQGFRLSSSIRLTGFNITPLAKLHATANFCSMKKKILQ